jgi:hypothetical protein
MRAPFTAEACTGCNGRLISDMSMLSSDDERFTWIVLVMRLCYTIVKLAAIQYRKNQETVAKNFGLMQAQVSARCLCDHCIGIGLRFRPLPWLPAGVAFVFSAFLLRAALV